MKKTLFSRIVVGIDGSEPSNYAAAYAARLARDHGSQLIVCFSANWIPIVADAGTMGAYVDAAAIIDGLKEEGNAFLDRAVATAKRFGVAAERRLVEGDPATSILKLAVEEDCSLIVMGTHGRRGIGRLFIGSTTELVLRESTIPVLTLRSETPAANEGRRCFERVLVGVDDSDPSDAALAVALDLPAEDRRELLIYSVIDIDIPFGVRSYSSIEAQRADEARSVVEHAVAAARAKNIEVRGLAVEGRPDDVIVNAAKEQAVDLIVVGSHGRRGLRRFFLGSVAEHVVRSAAVPTLVVRTAGAAVGAPTRKPELAASHV